MPQHSSGQRQSERDHRASARLKLIADAARELKRAGLPMELVLRALKSEFPDMNTAFGILPADLKDDFTKAHWVTKSDHGHDLNSEQGRVQFVKRIAQQRSLGSTPETAFAELVTQRPEVLDWVYCAPAVAAAVPADPVRKREPTVRDTLAERFNDMAYAKQRSHPTWSWERAYDTVLMSPEGQELYGLYADPLAERLTVREFAKTLDRVNPALATVAKRYLP